MHDRAVTAEVEALRQRFPALSMAPLALEMHVRALDRSVRTSSPDFVADADLDAIAPGLVTTVAAVELCLAGVWHRSVGGYAVDDRELIDTLSQPPSTHFSTAPLTSCLGACRRLWRVVNRDNFIPL